MTCSKPNSHIYIFELRITHWLLNPLPHYYISYTTCIYNQLLNYDVFIVGFNFILP